MLAPTSTGRILALLSPVLECKAPSGTAPTGKAAPSGKGEGFRGHSLEGLKSPFIDKEILPAELRNEFDSSVERLMQDSPIKGFTLDTLVVEIGRLTTGRGIDGGQ